MELDVRELQPIERYKLLIGGIVPRPIALVSTVSVDGTPNVAPFSFFCGVGSDPMTLLICPANQPDGAEKDTLRNAKPVAEGGQGEFVVNASVDRYIGQVAGAAEPLAYGDSEFDLVSLTPAPSASVAPPRVAESPLCFECRTVEVVRTAEGRPSAGNVVIAEVVHVYADDALLNERFHVDRVGLDAVGRMGGTTYCWTRDCFDLPPGRRAIDPQSESGDHNSK